MSVERFAIPTPASASERRAGAADPAPLSHLVAALVAGALFLTGLLGVSRYADSVVARHLYALAGSQYALKSYGLAVQREALRHDDLLLLYGSSEVDRESDYHARELFARAPTGFSAFIVGKRGSPLLVTWQNIGALGPDVREKKVAVLLSPPMFEIPVVSEEQYAGNFSPLHALTVLVSPDLSSGLKRRVARRLLDHPAPLERNKVLALTTRILADGRASRRALSAAVLPLAGLQQQLLVAQDKLLVLEYLLEGREGPGGPRQVVPRELNWLALVADATAQYRTHADNNPFGVDEAWWRRYGSSWGQARGRSEESFVRNMGRSESWDDLENLLRMLKELGAKPLILSMPIDGPFYDSLGISAAARRMYYTRVRSMTDRYGMPTAVLDDHESESYLFADLFGHISPKGWVYLDQALDAFYHDPLR